MSSYLILKHLHVTTAYLTVVLFALRLLLDAVGKPDWRKTPLRWIPHVNDTILLAAAISLLFVTPWVPLVRGWLTAKIFLLIGYLIAGLFALRTPLGDPTRVVAAVLALVPITALFPLEFNNPVPE